MIAMAKNKDNNPMIMKSFRMDAELASRFETWIQELGMYQERVLEAIALRVLTYTPREIVGMMRAVGEWKDAGRPPINPAEPAPDAGAAAAEEFAVKKLASERMKGQRSLPKQKQAPGVG